MATSTQSSLDNLRIQAVNSYKTWIDNYNETNGPIKRDDLVTIPPGFILPRPYNSSTGAVLNGTNGQFLKTNGSGGVEWADATTDVTVTPILTSGTTIGTITVNGSPTTLYAPAPTSITGGASSIVSSDLTASRALISNSSGKVAVSSITSTELGYLSGVTSSIQTQIYGRAPTSHASSGVGYGVGTSSNYGHLKLTDTISTNSTDAGYATTPAAVKTAYDEAIVAQDDLENITGVLINAPSGGYTSGNYAMSSDGSLYKCISDTSTVPSDNNAAWQAINSKLIDMIASKITYGTTDLTAGTSDLETGTIYVCYE